MMGLLPVCRLTMRVSDGVDIEHFQTPLSPPEPRTSSSGFVMAAEGIKLSKSTGTSVSW